MATLLTSTALALEVPVYQDEHLIDGRMTITKVYEVSSDVIPESLIESDFEQNGYIYSMTSITKDTIVTSEKKDITQTETITVELSDKTVAQASAMTQFPSFLEYNEDGYSGKLYPNLGSMTVESAGTTTSSGTKTLTKTYTYDYNDDSLVPQTADGYSLASISWAEGAYMDDSAIPENYIATAVYKKGYVTTTTIGWTFTMEYNGEVEYEEPDMMRYTITYVGVEPEPEEEPGFFERLFGGDKSNNDETSSSGIGAVLASILKGLLAVAAVAAAGFGGFVLAKSIKNSMIQILARDEVSGEYNSLKSIRFSKKSSIISIDTLAAPSTQHFRVVMKPALAESLKGKVVKIRAGQQVINHQIGDAGGADYFIDVNLD